MGDKAKWVPNFMVSWLKRTIHQDRVNAFLWESRHLTGTEWLTECVHYLDMTLDLVGEENLPDKNDGKLYTLFPIIRLAVPTALPLVLSSVGIMMAISAIW